MIYDEPESEIVTVNVVILAFLGWKRNNGRTFVQLSMALVRCVKDIWDAGFYVYYGLQTFGTLDIGMNWP